MTFRKSSIDQAKISRDEKHSEGYVQLELQKEL
jgi:hypothetical protein